MTWQIWLTIYLSLGVITYLVSLYLNRKRESNLPLSYTHPLVITVVVISWPILLLNALIRLI